MSLEHCPWISVWHVHLTSVISFCKPHQRCYNLFKEHCWPKRREGSETDVLEEQCFRANWSFLTRALGFLFWRYTKSVNNLHMPLAWCQMLAARLVESSQAAGKKMYPDFFNVFFFFFFADCYFSQCCWKAEKRIGLCEGYKRISAWSIRLFFILQFSVMKKHILKKVVACLKNWEKAPIMMNVVGFEK